MIRLALWSLALAVVLLATSCVSEFQQLVSVKVVGSNGAPVAGISLRYYSEPGCEGKFENVFTSGLGEGNFTKAAVRGRLYVVLERPSLCFEREGSWHVAWQKTIDPANQEQFFCTVSPASVIVCQRRSREGGT